jgi:hypothetical protein
LSLPFDLGDVAPEITLWAGTIEVSKENDSLVLESGRVFFSADPKPSIRFEATGVAADGRPLAMAFGEWQPDRVELLGDDLTGRLFPATTSVGGNLGPSGTVRASGRIAQVGTEEREPIVAASFGLLNFSDYLGTQVRYDDRVAGGRTELRAEGWRVTLDQRPGLKGIADRLRKKGGYAFTHVGKIERMDGGSFSTKDAISQLSALHWFLSLVRGAWVFPTLVEGHAESGETVWRQWGAGRVTAWSGSPTWCDPTGWEAAQEAYVGFLREWADDFGHGVIKLAVG